MFYLLSTYLERAGQAEYLRIFQYITFRAALAVLVGFFVGVILGPGIIRWLRRLKYGQEIRKFESSDAIQLTENHLKKQGTPTMGGIIILIGFLVPVLLLCNLTEPMILILLAMTVGFGLLGYRDDYLKITKKNSRGLSPKMKLLCQLTLGLVVGLFLKFRGEGIIYSLTSDNGGTHICVPFFKNFYPDIGWFIIPYSMLIVTSCSNASNLADGLDGLAVGVFIIVAAAYGLLAYLVGRPDFSHYLIIPFVSGGGEVAIFLAAIIGASAAFLWFNANPAQVFMGDTGSLTLGGLLGTIALFLKQEILLVIIGGIFVIEVLSVIIQVTTVKLWGKRFFKMTPIHHHFEKMNWKEPKIIARFYIIGTILALVGLTTLKLR